jgi:D-serine deaminase-like pyridoxal phosphate-dependent protein
MRGDWIGAEVSQLDTPVLLVDVDGLQRNIARMAEFSKSTGCAVRPHVKSHKTPLIARKQIDAGAIGVTCSKLGEAEVMVAGGISNILISTELVGDRKLARLVSLAGHAQITVVVDDRRNASMISTAASQGDGTLGVFVDVNVGQNRTGVEPGAAAADLAEYVAGRPNLRFDGLQGYEGNLQHIYDQEERRQSCEKAMGQLLATRSAVEARGMAVRVVSTAGTGTCAIAAAHRGVTEVQPGSYIFMDSDYLAVNGLPYELSLTLLTSVISRPRRGVAIVDAGFKAISTDAGLPKVKNLSNLEYKPHGDEHGRLESMVDDLLPSLGDVVELVPSHCDTTVNLHDQFFVTRNGRVQAVWPIAARGRVA